MNNINLEDLSFTTVNKQGLEVVCDILGTYYDEETNKLYAAFTDYFLDENDKIQIFITEVINTGDNYKLKDVEDKELRKRLLKDVFNNLS